jgi:Zn-dependent peptidase ImmA (M78 family)
MDERRIGYCRDLARTVLRRHGIRRLPVDVLALAKAEGIRVAEADLGSVEGRAYQAHDGWVIEVNSRRPWVSQRFSIGHEIGHIKFGHDACGEDPVQERQANVFAAELLMPLAALKEAMKSTRALGELAARFQVSREAMRIKLDEQRLLFRLTSFD